MILSILAYHMVDPRFDWGATRVTPGQFEKQIQYALKRGFSFYTLSDYIEKNRFNDEKALVITFDDGYKSIIQYAFPILQKYNIRATVFIIAGYIGQYNTWDVNIGWLRFEHLNWPDIAMLDEAGWEVGSHTLNHHDLTLLSSNDLADELLLSKMILETKLRKKIASISFPFGNANQTTIRLCQQTGYRFAVVMGNRIPGVPYQFTLDRLGVYLFDSQLSFGHKISGRHLKLYRFIQRILDLCSNGSVIVKYGFNSKLTKK